MTELLETYLSALPYPGRVVAVARLVDGSLGIAYGLTGRSRSSQDRKFVSDSDGSVHVEPKTAAPADDLRHYRAVASVDGWSVVGNGTQVDRIVADLASGVSPGEAVRSIEYEPDPPIYTPRITAIASDDGVLVTTAYRADTVEGEPQVLTVSVAELPIGAVLCAHTYRGDGMTVVPMMEIKRLRTAASTADELCSELWNGLASDLRVSALAVIHPQVGPSLRIQDTD